MPTDRVAVLVPGIGYTAQGPLLAYAGLAAERRGAEVRAIKWAPPPAEDVDERIAWVRDQVADVLGADSALVVGKSLGSLSAGLVADRGLPAVWLTPLLNRPQVVASLRAAPVPPLLIGGTADRTWDGQVARSLSAHVVEIPDADHAMYVPGRALASARVVTRVVESVEAYLDGRVWPG